MIDWDWQILMPQFFLLHLLHYATGQQLAQITMVKVGHLVELPFYNERFFFFWYTIEQNR